ncbi:VC2046/SO_2500 family protein [Pseudaeromonas sp. ZJS20]|uniref:VC2046/SO_2500 family protein n=1 Tax=Pseudaeromonas aegiceratis TaxID=3153928 RepID=UPI00390C82DD
MLTETIRRHCLVDELQLGQDLNQALQGQRQADFALLLAMLSSDVQDQAWVADPPLPEAADDHWRDHFGLPAQRPLAAHDGSAAHALAMAEQLAEGGAAAVRLYDALCPEALVPGQFALGHGVWDNLTPLSRHKHGLARRGELLAHVPLQAPPSAMLDAIHDADTLTRQSWLPS